MKKITLLLLTILSVVSMYGQTGSIKGEIATNEKEPIPGVNVKILNTTKGTTTDNSGEYEIKNIKAGTYVLKVSSVGYAPQEITIDVKDSQITNVSNIVMHEKAEQLKEIVLEGENDKSFVAKTPSTSLRLKSSLIKTPQNIQVITSEVIKSQQAINMMESVTRNVSGAQMIEHWGHFARINMRGFNLPAFRNGMNVQMPWGPLAEDMSMVERIEFVKGPAGFMMSAGEPGGFYNVVTKKPTENKIIEATFTAGSFNLFRGTIDMGGALTSDKKFMARLNAMVSKQEAHRKFEESSRLSIVPSFKYAFTDKTSITTEFTYQQANTPIGRAYVFGLASHDYGSLSRDFATLGDDFPNTDIEEISLFTNFTHSFNDNWAIEAQHSYTRYDQEGYSHWAWTLEDNGDLGRRVNAWDALNLTQLAQLYVTGKFNTAGISHNILAGLDYTDKQYWADWYQSEFIDTTSPFNIFNPVYGNSVIPTIDRTENIRVRGAGAYQGIVSRGYYIQNEIGFLNDKIRLTLAGRYTNADVFAYGNTTEASKFTPRAGLSVDILPTFTVYGLYDQSFIPKFGASVTGEKFDPEEATDIEGGLKKTWFDGKLSTNLTVYQITKENIVVGDPNNPNFSIQLGEVQSKGIEFDMQGQITPELNIILNYANTNVEITEDTDPAKIGTKIAGHAEHITNGWLNYNFKESSAIKGFGLSLGYQYQVNRSSWNWRADNESALPDYFRLDAGLSWRNEKLDIRLNVNNLLDEYLYSGSAYSSFVYWQSEPGIHGRLTVAYTF